ncbi:putative CI repressor [Candidatus Magnetomoraceae bacterium gMMP-15]
MRKNIVKIFERLKNYKGFRKDGELANFLGVKPNTISTYKKRDKIPHDILFSICDNENMNYNWLLTGKGSMYINDEELALDHSPRVKTITRMLKKMSEEDLKDIERKTKKIIENIEIKKKLEEMEKMMKKAA